MFNPDWIELRLMKYQVRVHESGDRGRWFLVQFPDRRKVGELFQNFEGELDFLIEIPYGEFQEVLQETLEKACDQANNRE